MVTNRFIPPRRGCRRASHPLEIRPGALVALGLFFHGVLDCQRQLLSAFSGDLKWALSELPQPGRTALRARGGEVATPIELQVLQFGKYRDETIKAVLEKDPSYLSWLRNITQDSKWTNRPTVQFAKFLSGDVEGDGSARMRFGKHSTLTHADVQDREPDYCRWFMEVNMAFRAICVTQYLEQRGFSETLPTPRQRNEVLFDFKVRVDLESSDRYKHGGDAKRRYLKDNLYKQHFREKSYGTILQEYIENHVQVDESDATSGLVNVTLARCEIGQRLFEEGIITGSRVYSSRGDPFALPSTLNAVLTDRFYVNVDDSKAHPRYMRMLTRDKIAQEILDDFLARPGDIMRELAEYYLKRSDAEALEDVKMLLHMLGMDGSPATWKRKMNLEGVRDHTFIERYADAMHRVTKELAGLPEGQRATELILRSPELRKKKTRDGATTKVRNPERTWKSFLLQEIEFVSLQAKIRVAEKYDGHGSLEHDGLKLVRGPKLAQISEEELERELSEAVTEACYQFVRHKYNPSCDRIEVPVKIKKPDLESLLA